MKFDSSSTVEMVTYQLRESDWVRGQNRARINDLFNGAPPYSGQEVEENDIKINVNDLASTRAGHSARAQYYSAFLQQDRFFSAKTDMGPQHKREEYGQIVTSAAARTMKRGVSSLPYFEHTRSKAALLVLHGVGPGAWEDRDKWCPDPLGIEDVLIPADTYLTMKNLPFFAIYRSYTVPELIKLTSGPKVDKGWNLPLVEKCIEWADQESTALMGSNWPQYWSAEKMAERKLDSGWYAGDRVPPIDTLDFYFWSDEKKHQGWRRRMILDAWGTPELGAKDYSPQRKRGDLYNSKDSQFLFNPGARCYARSLSELLTFQFADLSAVAPFRYHSVRSLGKLLYAVCHLQNRMRSKFNEAVFEALMQYFRISGEDEFQRALKVEMINRGFIDQSIKMVPAAERWQVNAPLIQLGLDENRGLIDAASAGYSQNTNYSSDRTEKTKFQVMAELQGMTAMLNAGLMQAYAYQTFEYQEIFRRLCNKSSTDPDVRAFRNSVLRQGVPEEILIPEAFELESEQIMGGGNQSLQMAIAQQLLEMRPLYDPEPQRQILRDITFAVTGDAAKTKSYVPDGPQPISNSVHDAQVSLGTILAGFPVASVSGQNHIEIVEVWLAELSKIVQQTHQQGGVPESVEKLRGMLNLGQHIAQQIVIIAQNQEEKERVKSYSDALGQLMNEIKAFGQRLQEKMQEQNGQSGIDPETLAKVQAMILQAQTKSQNSREQSQQKEAQKALKFEREMKEREVEFVQDMKQRGIETQVEVAAQDAKVAAEIQREAAKPNPKAKTE
jgi:hypothetical protein